MSAPTAAQVRSYFRARPAKVQALSAEAQRTVAADARGSLHPEVVKAYNVKRAKDKRYVLGASKRAKAVTAAQRAALIERGLAGARGPLSKEAKAALRKGL